MSVSKRKIKQIPLAYYSANIVVPLWPRCLKQRWTAGDTPVVIVLDNTRYQHCQAMKDKTEQLGINLIFLRPYSKLKIIERLWKYTRRHVLAGKYFYSPARFHDVLKHFFEVDYINHKQNLSSLLTLNSQSFENAHLLCA